MKTCQLEDSDLLWLIRKEIILRLRAAVYAHLYFELCPCTPGLSNSIAQEANLKAHFRSRAKQDEYLLNTLKLNVF